MTAVESLRVTREIASPEISQVHGLTFDGTALWCAEGAAEEPVRVDLQSGKITRRLAGVPADAGTAFDGTYLWQIGGDRARRIDLDSGKVVHEIQFPDSNVSGLSWADGRLWVGSHVGKHLMLVDPETGAVLRRLASDAHVCGVTWTAGALWHCAWTTRSPTPEGRAELRRLDPDSGQVLRTVLFPDWVSGIEADGRGGLYCGLTTGGRILHAEMPR